MEVAAGFHDVGVGIRVLKDNGWGYGATNLLTRGHRPGCKSRSSQRRCDHNPEPAVIEAVSGNYRTPLLTDPFEVAEETTAIYERAHRTMLDRAGEVRTRHLHCASSDSDPDGKQRLASGPSDQSLRRRRSAIAVHDGDVQVRSSPKSFEGNLQQGI